MRHKVSIAERSAGGAVLGEERGFDAVRLQQRCDGNNDKSERERVNERICQSTSAQRASTPEENDSGCSNSDGSRGRPQIRGEYPANDSENQESDEQQIDAGDDDVTKRSHKQESGDRCNQMQGKLF